MKTSKKCIHTEQRMGIILSKSRYSSAEVLGIWKCVFMYLTMCISRYICVYVYEKLHICLAVRQNAGSEFPLASSTNLVNENNMFQLCVCLIYFKIDPSWSFDIYIIGITDYISSLISEVNQEQLEYENQEYAESGQNGFYYVNITYD